MFQDISSKWDELLKNEGTSVSDFVSFKEEIMEALGTASSREERKYLSELLSTVQNKVFSFSKSEQDKLSSVLSSIPDFSSKAVGD